MKGRPIIMSGNHPKLILDGEKSMTRRVIKPQPTPTISDEQYKANMSLCPELWKYQVGDKLWVKETHIYYTDPFAIECYVGFRDGTGKSVDDFPEGSTVVNIASDPKNWKWRPSIHMYRWASRITLEITEVRVERTQSISAGDCTKEGIPYEDGDYVSMKVFDKFRKLWDSLNAKRGYGWETNCWVWVISFKLVG